VTQLTFLLSVSITDPAPMTSCNATGTATAPRAASQLYRGVQKLQTENVRLKAFLVCISSDLKPELMDVRKTLQSNTQLVQENVFLRDAIAKEMDGQWPSSWMDPTDKYFDDAGDSLDNEWNSSLEALNSSVEQYCFPRNDHDGLPKMSEEIEETCFEWPSPFPKVGKIAHAGNPRSLPSWCNESDEAPPLVSRSLLGDCQLLPPQSVQSLGCPQIGPTAWLEAETSESMRKQPEELANTDAGEDTVEPTGELESAQNTGVILGSEGNGPHEQSFPEVGSKPPRALPPGVTTLMVRNIPARFTPEKLLEVWPVDGSYNLLHMPFNFQKQRRAGIAFVNMVSHEAAVEFAAKWHGRKLANVGGIKRLDIGAAEVQGFEGNLRNFKGSKIKNDIFLPIAFNGTERLDIKALLQGHRERGVQQDAPPTDEPFTDARFMAQQASSSSRHGMACS